MGCASSRIDASFEEAAMINGDNKLYFYNYNVNRLFSEFKAVAEHGHVALEQLGKLAKKLPLIYEEKPEVVGFYARLAHSGRIDFKVLATLAVLLAEGTVSDKVNVLFETWFSTYLDRDLFARLLDEIFRLSVELLPTIASKPDSSNSYTPESFQLYLKRAEAGIATSSQAILNAIFEKGYADKAIILAWAQTGENYHWLNARFIRAELKKIGKRVLHREKKKVEEKVEEKTSIELGTGNVGVSASLSGEHHHS